MPEGWHDVPASAAAFDDDETSTVDFVVVEGTQQDAVFHVRGSALTPRFGVVHFAPADWCAAPGRSALAVSGRDGSTLGGGEKALFAAEVENLPGAAARRDADEAVAHHLRGDTGRDRFPGALQVGNVLGAYCCSSDAGLGGHDDDSGGFPSRPGRVG